MKIFYRLSLLLFLVSGTIALQASGPDKDSTILFGADESVDSNFEPNLDSLLNLYYVQQSVNIDSIRFSMEPGSADTSEFNIPDSVIIDRLSKIPSVVDLTYNRIVRNYIKVYTMKRRENVEVMLGLSKYYFPIFDDIFDYYGVPNELKYMSIIESALNPRAYSRARAVGLWQFMYGTGRLYGLTINSYVDERRDPIKSTIAAAKFVKDLYDIYQDWTLVIAAYNCGPGNVNKAIRRSGGKTNYWDIYYYLPRETRGHVPAFIAAVYTMNYYREHDLYPADIELPIAADTIMVHNKLHLKQVSDVLDIPLKELRDMNPQYTRDIIPATGKSYALSIPFNYTAQFIDLKDSIFGYKDSVYFDNPSVVTPHYASRTFVPRAPSGNMTRLYYTVKPGDNLGYISQWYNVRISDLRYWNNIRRNLIRGGQKLVVYVPKKKSAYYAKINHMSFSEKQRAAGISVPGETVTASVPVEENSDYIYYTVRSGDTIWDIAKKFPGVSDSDIIKINHFSYSEKIKPGQRIKIKRKN